MKNNDELVRDYNQLADQFGFLDWSYEACRFLSREEYWIQYQIVYIENQKLMLAELVYDDPDAYFGDDDVSFEQHDPDTLKSQEMTEYVSFNQWFYDYHRADIHNLARNRAQNAFQTLFSAYAYDEPRINVVIQIENQSSINLQNIPKSLFFHKFFPLEKRETFGIGLWRTLFCFPTQKFAKLCAYQQQYQSLYQENVHQVCQEIYNEIKNLGINAKYGLTEQRIEIDDYFKLSEPIDVHQAVSDIKKQAYEKLKSKIDLFAWQKYVNYLCGVLLVLAWGMEYVRPDYLGFWHWLGLLWLIGLLAGVRVLEILQKYLINRRMKRFYKGLDPDAYAFLLWRQLWDWQQKCCLAILCLMTCYWLIA